MSQLGNIINRLLIERRLTASELCERSGVQKATLSRLRSGKRDSLAKDDLSNLARALGRNKTERAEIIAAHLRDESCDCESIQIQINGRATRETMEPDIEYLAKHFSDSRLRALVKSAVKLHRNGN